MIETLLQSYPRSSGHTDDTTQFQSIHVIRSIRCSIGLKTVPLTNADNCSKTTAVLERVLYLRVGLLCAIRINCKTSLITVQSESPFYSGTLSPQMIPLLLHFSEAAANT